ncbi:unnamed protein product [Polarella glacialis]|uniref:Uncharacterized protein n=1 Tax=Polarella glacialis TaxID=89957 RepID=A0A813L4W0_POLGL|nr:unnamed protein product [Polarella glacialis]
MERHGEILHMILLALGQSLKVPHLADLPRFLAIFLHYRGHCQPGLEGAQPFISYHLPAKHNTPGTKVTAKRLCQKGSTAEVSGGKLPKAEKQAAVMRTGQVRTSCDRPAGFQPCLQQQSVEGKPRLASWNLANLQP